jgi:hypothetical protein
MTSPRLAVAVDVQPARQMTWSLRQQTSNPTTMRPPKAKAIAMMHVAKVVVVAVAAVDVVVSVVLTSSPIAMTLIARMAKTRRAKTAMTGKVRTAKAVHRVDVAGVVVAVPTVRTAHPMIRRTPWCEYVSRVAAMRSPVSRVPRDSKPRSSADAKGVRLDDAAHPS